MPPPLPWIGSIMIAATGPSTPRWSVSRIGAAQPASHCPSGPCWARRQQRYAYGFGTRTKFCMNGMNFTPGP